MEQIQNNRVMTDLYRENAQFPWHRAGWFRRSSVLAALCGPPRQPDGLLPPGGRGGVGARDLRRRRGAPPRHSWPTAAPSGTPGASTPGRTGASWPPLSGRPVGRGAHHLPPARPLSFPPPVHLAGQVARHLDGAAQGRAAAVLCPLTEAGSRRGRDRVRGGRGLPGRRGRGRRRQPLCGLRRL